MRGQSESGSTCRRDARRDTREGKRTSGHPGSKSYTEHEESQYTRHETHASCRKCAPSDLDGGVAWPTRAVRAGDSEGRGEEGEGGGGSGEEGEHGWLVNESCGQVRASCSLERRSYSIKIWRFLNRPRGPSGFLFRRGTARGEHVSRWRG